MEMHQLRYFVAVAETGSFSRAAERCYVSQPSLSLQIKKLEEELGQPLFDRLRRGVALTDAGKLLLPRAKQILQQAREVEEQLKRQQSIENVPLAVGVLPTIAPYLLPLVVGRMLASHPQCQLQIREDLTERLLEALVNNEIDCALVSLPAEHELVETEVLAQERLLLVVPNSPNWPQESCALKAIEDFPIITLHEMHCLGQQIDSFCAQQALQRRIVCRSAELSTLQTLVAMGLGVSLVPEMCASRSPLEGCRYLPLADEGIQRAIVVAWRRDRSRGHLARHFVEQVRDVLQSGALRYQPTPSL